jgi:predicted enzyme related to lactoylglutathione lyase
MRSSFTEPLLSVVASREGRGMTILAMTKLVVGDVEKAKTFYEAVCGVREVRRIEGAVGGRPITELIMQADAEGGATLVLFREHDTPAPTPGSCVLVFDTDDVDAFLERAVAAGGSVMQPKTSLPDFGLSYAFVRDPEGHILEPLSRKA